VMGPICQGAGQAQSLTAISFKANGIASEAAIKFRMLLQDYSLLSCLDLRTNALGDDGATTLAECLIGNARLTKLVLFDTQLGEIGAHNILEALKVNTTLISVDLSSNALGSPLVSEALKRMLCGNRSIEDLFLWQTSLDCTAIITIAEGVAENNRLKRLELRRNPVGVSGLISLRLAVTTSASLYKVLVDVPDYSDPTKEELAIEAYVAIQNIAIKKLTCAADEHQVSARPALSTNAEDTPGLGDSEKN